MSGPACRLQTFQFGSASALERGHLSQNLVPADGFCRVESAQNFVVTETALLVEMRATHLGLTSNPSRRISEAVDAQFAS
jgi:hypothetical protein